MMPPPPWRSCVYRTVTSVTAQIGQTSAPSGVCWFFGAQEDAKARLAETSPDVLHQVGFGQHA